MVLLHVSHVMVPMVRAMLGQVTQCSLVSMTHTLLLISKNMQPAIVRLDSIT